MTGSNADAIWTGVAIAVIYGAPILIAHQFSARRTPAAIVRRLLDTGQPVTLRVNGSYSTVWDPSQRPGRGAFFTPGTATYTLVDPSTIQVRFEPRTGAVVEHSGPILASMLPDAPETRHRRRVARAVVALYLTVGVVAFILTDLLISGSSSFRARSAALISLGTVAIAWLITHVVLTRPRRVAPSEPSIAGSRRPAIARARQLAAWMASLIVISAALAVAWRIDSLTQPDPTPWASAFVDAGVFVLLTEAVVAATLHHYNYVHHADHHATPRATP